MSFNFFSLLPTIRSNQSEITENVVEISFDHFNVFDTQVRYSVYCVVISVYSNYEEKYEFSL